MMEMMEIIGRLQHLKCLVCSGEGRVQCLFSFSSRIVNTSELQLQSDEFKSAGPVGVSSEQGSRGVSITLLCSWWCPNPNCQDLVWSSHVNYWPDKYNCITFISLELSSLQLPYIPNYRLIGNNN